MKLRVQSQELKDAGRGKPETEYSLITRQSSEKKNLTSPEQYAHSQFTFRNDGINFRYLLIYLNISVSYQKAYFECVSNVQSLQIYKHKGRRLRNEGEMREQPNVL